MRRPWMMLVTCLCLATACDDVGGCPMVEEAGTCTWVESDDDGEPVIAFVGDDGTEATYNEDDGFVGYAGDYLYDCTASVEVGATFPCTLVDISGGCEPGLFITCD